jgi:hypothetical protein
MDNPIRRPEEILAYRSLRLILASKPKALWAVSPADSVLKALQIMAEKDIGLVVAHVSPAPEVSSTSARTPRRWCSWGPSPRAAYS